MIYAIVAGVIVLLLGGGYAMARRSGRKEEEMKYTKEALEARKEDAEIDSQPDVDDPLGGLQSEGG